MRDFRRANLPKVTPIQRTRAQKIEFAKALKEFESEMRTVRAESISKSTRSHLSASKTFLNR